MATEGQTFDQWLKNAKVPRHRLSPQQLAVLQAAFGFLQRCGRDYYSLRMLSHFLLNCDAGLKVAQVARLVNVSRQTASGQQKLTSKQVIQSAHNRMAGRPYGKLLPRYAGPVAQFLMAHPNASRGEIIHFIARTWNVRVSTVALYHFMKKYGLDRAGRSLASAAEGRDPLATEEAQPPAAGLPVPLPKGEFFSRPRSTPAPSSCCPRP
jgi:hypothetical protein